ncbi:hypothetical protein HAZT_HAZT010833 [Hyalella azteca]|uniref:Neurotransmitter-gated ion-channel ligand-binding domain-containing protein n=1 Tax=Hyalella azteca TaxID=294128 RepID=A0A6A0GSU5_HYAAZ|nr:hypothetical protein HAZT_HAZT010833 [Hyalella azteca]
MTGQWSFSRRYFYLLLGLNHAADILLITDKEYISYYHGLRYFDNPKDPEFLRLDSWSFYCHLARGDNFTVLRDGMKILDAKIDTAHGKMPLNGIFIVGQEQDLLGGGFNADESFHGKMALLNIWNYSIDPKQMKDMRECRSIGNGNVFSLQKDAIDKFEVLESYVPLTEFCSVENKYWVLNGPNTFYESGRICDAFGGFLFTPNTQKALTQLYDLTSASNYACNSLTVYVGITDEEEEGTWRNTKDGTIFEENLFLNGEPNDGRDYNCAILSSKEAALIDYNCSEAWPNCAPCMTHRTLRLRGLCFNSETESFMNLRGYVNESIYICGYYGINIHNMLGTSEWHLFDSNLQQNIAEITLPPGETYPIGRKMWSIVSKTCDHREGSLIALSISACSGDEYACDNAECIPRAQLCDGAANCADLSDENNCNILGIPEGYSIIRSPGREFGDVGPIFVSIHVDVLRFFEIDDKRNLIGLEIKIEMKWRDRRLVYYNLGDKMEDNELPQGDLERIWTPTLVFPSAHKGFINHIYDEVHVVKNGTRKQDDFNSIHTNFEYAGASAFLVLHKHLSGKFACSFNVFRYPFDKHHCDVLIHLGLSSERLVTFNNDSLSLTYAGTQQLVRFSVEKMTAQAIRVKRNTTFYSGIKIDIFLAREPSVVMLTLFLPTVLLACIGYCTLFVKVKYLEVRS